MSILNRIKFLCLILWVSLLLLRCTENNTNSRITPKDIYKTENNKISIINLISNPGSYDKKKVQIKGFVNFEFENCAIYLSKDDYNKGIDKNAIWIQVSKKEIAKFAAYNKKYVLLEGVFEMNNKGHENDFSGALNGLSMIKVIN